MQVVIGRDEMRLPSFVGWYLSCPYRCWPRAPMPHQLGHREHRSFNGARSRLQNDDLLAPFEHALHRCIIYRMNQTQVKHWDAAEQLKLMGQMKERCVGRSNGEETDRHAFSRARHSTKSIQLQSPSHTHEAPGLGPSGRPLSFPLCQRGVHRARNAIGPALKRVS